MYHFRRRSLLAATAAAVVPVTRSAVAVPPGGIASDNPDGLPVVAIDIAHSEYSNRFTNLDAVLGPWSAPVLTRGGGPLALTSPRRLLANDKNVQRYQRAREGWVFVPQATPLIVDTQPAYCEVWGPVRLRQHVWPAMQFTTCPVSGARIYVPTTHEEELAILAEPLSCPGAIDWPKGVEEHNLLVSQVYILDIARALIL